MRLNDEMMRNLNMSVSKKPCASVPTCTSNVNTFIEVQIELLENGFLER